jgi:hypothetical protein
MIAIMTGPLIVSPVQAFWIMIQQVPTIFTQTHFIAIFREIYTTICATMMIGQAFLTTTGAVLTGMIVLQAGLMIGKVVRGIAGTVPAGIAKFGL